MKFLKLGRGAHTVDSGSGCAMEAVAALNGEMWTDNPECVCPVIGAFVQSFNDFLPDGLREKYLTPDLLIRLIGTRGDLDSAVARARIAAKSAAESAKSAAKSAAKFAAESAAQAAKYAQLAQAAEFAAEIYALCVDCIEEMLLAGPHAPVEPKHSLE